MASVAVGVAHLPKGNVPLLQIIENELENISISAWVAPKIPIT
jgi:hypothetical protein